MWSISVVFGVIFIIVSEETDDYDAMAAIAVLGVFPSVILSAILTLVVHIDNRFESLMSQTDGNERDPLAIPKSNYQNL